MSIVRAVKRAFVDVAHRQMHYRHAGSEHGGLPLLVLHASPGSSRQQVALIEDMATVARVVAPDTPGNGDSDPLPLEAPEVADLARAVIGFMDATGLDRANIYGSHTGAAIAGEIAVIAPERVGKLLLDGIAVMEGAELEDILTHYANPFPADLDGAYLMRAFHFLRDQYSFFPWYRRTRAAARESGLGRPEDLHAWLVELLKANETYHLNYRAAFQWNAPERMPLIACPTLAFAAETDPLIEDTRAVASLPAHGRFAMLPRGDDAGFRQARADLIRGFLAD